MKIKKSDLTSELIHAWFDYDDVTGHVLSRKTGEPVGNIGYKGRRSIDIAGIRFMNTHIIWMLLYDRFPLLGMVIHHRDNDPSNDRIENLIEVNKQEDDELRRYGRKWWFLT